MISAMLPFVDLFNPEAIIRFGGVALLLFIIFAETGLFFGFFLPGDSLLFIAGLLCNSQFGMSVWVLIALLVVAATAGTTVGYGFGRWSQRYLKNRRENFFYKKRYLDMAQEFYQKYGMMAFVMGRFLPVVRTFVPILAGMVRIAFGRFFFFNLVGASVWIVVMVLAGHLLGKRFPTIVDHLELIVAGMVLITTIPLVLSWLRHRNMTEKQNSDQN